MKDYSSIINLSQKTSPNHKPMSLYERAAQFQPFSALTGYDDLLSSATKTYDKKMTLSEDKKSIINDQLLHITKNIKTTPFATFVYFNRCNNQNVGKYIEVSGKVKKIDLSNKIIILTNNINIPIDDIIDIFY